MPIVGAHMLFYTPEAAALRAMLRDIFGWEHVEGHEPPDGWLIFRLPPSELGVHPAEQPGHQVTLMCRDIDSTIEELRSKGVEVRGEPQERDFGIVTTVVLPGGVDVLLYEPKHNSPLDV